MKIRIWLAIIGALIAIMELAGCGVAGAQTTSSANPVTSQPVNVNVNSQQGIWVSGQGKVTVIPDIAILNLGVTAQAASVADAQSQAAAAMDKVMSVLTSNGIDKKDISTQYFSINPLTRYDNTTQQSTITGYQVNNFVNATIRTVSKTGSIIDAVASAAGNLARINSISFTVSNPSQYYAQARELAVNDAKSKAQQLASLAGVTLGKATYINETSPLVPAPVNALPAQAIPAPTTSISPGQTDITLAIQVAYAIQ